jgi:hypothetical protein
MTRHRLLAALSVALLGGAAPAAFGATALAGKYTWFDETPGQRPLTGTGALLRGDSTRVQFDVPLKSLPVRDEDSAATPASEPAWGTLRLYRIQGEALSAESDNRRASTVGVNWQHRLFPQDRISLTAEAGENLTANSLSQDTFESRAAVSWTREWNVRWRPSLTGSMFIGDESARLDAYRQQLGRRYVGFSFGGQLNIGRDHTPYLSYQLRRSYYGNEVVSAADELLPPRTDDRSLLTAGWRWQATRQLSLKAEASFGLNPDGLDLYNQERTRVLFGTRFDFR